MTELFRKEIIEICREFSETFKDWRHEPTIFEVNKVTDLYLYEKNKVKNAILVNNVTKKWIYVFRKN